MEGLESNLRIECCNNLGIIFTQVDFQPCKLDFGRTPPQHPQMYKFSGEFFTTFDCDKLSFTDLATLYLENPSNHTAMH